MIMMSRKFYIKDDSFWKDGNHFQIIGGDLHYFRVLPEVLSLFLDEMSFFFRVIHMIAA